MNEHEKRLLLCTNGATPSLAALEYGVWLAGVLKAQVTLLGAVEQPDMRRAVEQALDDTKANLETMGISPELSLVKGDTVEVIRQTAVPDKHLVVFGPLGRSRWRQWL